MNRWGLIGLVALGMLGSVGCSSDGGSTDNQAAGGQGGSAGSAATGGMAGGGGSGTTAQTAQGVSIQEVAIYQGVKRSLMVGGQAVDSDVPLVAGRDALVRVFYATDSGYSGGEITARLHLPGEDGTFEVKGPLLAASTDADSQYDAEFPGARRVHRGESGLVGRDPRGGR